MRPDHLLVLIPLLLALSADPPHAADAPLAPEPVWVIGAEDDTVLVPEPLFAVPLPTGHTLVFAKSSCTFHRFDGQWRRVGVFGRCGEGPGEYSRSEAGFVVGDELWVFQQNRIMISDLEGTFLRTVSLAEHAMGEPLPLGPNWIGRDRASSNRLLVVDAAGELVGAPLDRGETEDHLSRAGVIGDGVLFYGSQSGAFFRCPLEGPARPIKALRFGKAEVVREHRGNDVVEYWTSQISNAWTDAEGRLYVVAGEDRDEENPRQIPAVRRYRPDYQSYETLPLPKAFPFGRVYWGWNDRVLVLDRWGSRIFVFALREG